jgi:hypothetical protein
MNDDTHTLEFHESLEDTDFGLIICGKTGALKGLWVPKGMDEEPVPESIVRMCVDIFGIDEKEFDYVDDDLGDPPTGTLH